MPTPCCPPCAMPTRDLICLAGYMRKVPDTLIAAYPGRIMNIHAALLPAFGGKGMYGLHIHEAVLDYGAKVSGCTVHFVDGSYDTGPIILQTPVPVEEDDTAETLAARVLARRASNLPPRRRPVRAGPTDAGRPAGTD